MIPLGTQVIDANGNEVGAVGQDSQLFVRGAEEGGTLTVKWGGSETQKRCVNYHLPVRASGMGSAGIDTTDAMCR